MTLRKRLSASLALTAAVVLAAQSLAFAQEEAAQEPPSIVATTEILGAVVGEIAGEAADVTTLMPAGVDPHAWAPSARDVERVMQATLVVENGLGLEEGLLAVLDEARAEGIPVFTASDHITVRMQEGDHAAGEEHHEHEGESDHAHGHSHGPEDPHIWLDPVTMGSIVEAMVPAMAEVGIDVSDRADAYVAELAALDAEIEQMLAGIPDEKRKIVSGHEALGYYADRYGLEQVGAVIPSLSTSGDPSAQDVAALIDTMEDAGVTVVFMDVGTPQPIAEAVADATGADVVPLRVEQLPADGSYLSFMRELTKSVAGALGS